MIDTLRLRWTIDGYGAAAGTDASAGTPLARALRSVVENGKPGNRLAQTYLQGPDDVLRWFGVFVHSAGGRVLFFPGFTCDRVEGMQGTGAGAYDRHMMIDHFSLDPDGRWHITSPRSREHQSSGSAALGVAPGTRLWFGMTAKDVEVFAPVYRETVIDVPVPRNDAGRRVELVRKAHDDAKVFQALRMAGAAPTELSAPHFSVFVQTVGAPEYEGDVHAFPEGSPFLSHPLVGPAQIPMRRHSFDLSSDLRLQVDTAWIPAGPQTVVTLTSPGR